MAEAGPTNCYLLSAAIDFGTTFSGYAYSFKNDPMKIQTNAGWNAGSEKLISYKAPTCVLLNPSKEFNSFGFDAENKYVDLANDKEHSAWLLFRRFKMILHNNEVLQFLKLTTMNSLQPFLLRCRYKLIIFQMQTICNHYKYLLA